MIKVLVCDGDDTLSLSNPSSQVKQLLQALPGLGIQLAVASNAPNRLTVENRFQRAGLPIPNVIVTRAEIGTPKPSPESVINWMDCRWRLNWLPSGFPFSLRNPCWHASNLPTRERLRLSKLSQPFWIFSPPKPVICQLVIKPWATPSPGVTDC